jgi:hypothetical protein
MTDPGSPDPRIAERLAHLQSRRARSQPTQRATRADDTPAQADPLAPTTNTTDAPPDPDLAERLAQLQSRRARSRPALRATDADDTPAQVDPLAPTAATAATAATDADPIPDPDIAERLANLQTRRSRGPSASRVISPDGRPARIDPSAATTTNADPATGAATPTPTTTFDRAHGGRSTRRRRRSPAATAKIVTVGASTTAMLGLIAGYGYAEGRPDGPDLTDAQTAPGVPTPGALLPVAPASALTPSPPRVIVVLVDRSTGEQITTVAGATRDQALAEARDVVRDLGAGDAGFDPAIEVATPVAAAPAAVVVAEPVPVPAPAAIDLAVPVPPSPPPAAPVPASAPPAAPTPAPQASSGGS